LKEEILVMFPLANDVIEHENHWVDIGSNAKCRIDDMVHWAVQSNVDMKIVFAFAAGTDLAHADGLTLATLGHDYFMAEYGSLEFDSIVNHEDADVYGTDPEIIWGVKEAQKRYPAEQYKLSFIFGTQRRHVPRVEKILDWRFSYLRAPVFTTSQTKEIPLYREAISWVKLMLGDGRVAQRVQQLRRANPDRFDRA